MRNFRMYSSCRGRKFFGQLRGMLLCRKKIMHTNSNIKTEREMINAKIERLLKQYEAENIALRKLLDGLLEKIEKSKSDHHFTKE